MGMWIIATLIAYFVKGISGFANTLVLTSILSFGTSNVDISPVDLILGLPANAIMSFRNRKKIKWKMVLPLALLVIIGALPGAFILKFVNVRYVKIAFGVLVIIVSLEMFLRTSGKLKLKQSKVFLWVIGLLSGILCGMFGVGALLAAYVGRFANTGDEFKGSISTVFLCENIFRIITYSVMGIISLESLKLAAIMIPFMLIGLGLGTLCSSKLKEKVVMKIVIGLLFLSGVALILTNI